MGVPLDVEVRRGRPIGQQREDYLHEQRGLKHRLGAFRLSQPCPDLGDTGLGDHVALTVRADTRFGSEDADLPVALEAVQRAIQLAERQRAAAVGEQRVVLSLQFVAVARLRFEQAKQCGGNVHPSSAWPPPRMPKICRRDSRHLYVACVWS